MKSNFDKEVIGLLKEANKILGEFHEELKKDNKHLDCYKYSDIINIAKLIRDIN